MPPISSRKPNTTLDARALLLTDDVGLADAVESALARRLATLQTAQTAATALGRHGYSSVVPLTKAVAISNALAPEHLELHGEAAERLAGEVKAYGALFIGTRSAEVFGDYGIGPNHVLPTSSCARFSGGLSVYTFLTVRNFAQTLGAVDAGIIDDTVELARTEGLTHISKPRRVDATGRSSRSHGRGDHVQTAPLRCCDCHSDETNRNTQS